MGRWYKSSGKTRSELSKDLSSGGSAFAFLTRGAHYVFLFALLSFKRRIKEMDLLGFRMCFTLIGKVVGISNLIWKDINFESRCRPWVVMSAKKNKYYFQCNRTILRNIALIFVSMTFKIIVLLKENRTYTQRETQKYTDTQEY